MSQGTIGEAKVGGTGYSWRSEFGNAYAERRVLVTGDTGFIGGHLCEALIALDARVTGVSLGGLRSSESQWPSYAIDLADRTATQKVVEEMRPHVVFHLAGLVTASRDSGLVLPMLQANLVNTVYLFATVLESGCDRIVIAGSAEEPRVGAVGADAIPTSPYAAAKAAATLYARMFHGVYGLPVVIVRPLIGYGPRQEPTKLTPYIILSLLHGEAPSLSGGTRLLDFVYVLDLVRGLLRAGVQPGVEGATIDLGTGQGIDIRSVARMLVELCGSNIGPAFGGVSDRANDRSLIADPSASWALLGWKPRWSLAEGLAETVMWYRGRRGAQ